MQCRLCTTAMPPTLTWSVIRGNKSFDCAVKTHYPPLPSSNGMASLESPSFCASESGRRDEKAGLSSALQKTYKDTVQCKTPTEKQLAPVPIQLGVGLAEEAVGVVRRGGVEAHRLVPDLVLFVCVCSQKADETKQWHVYHDWLNQGISFFSGTNSPTSAPYHWRQTSGSTACE